MLAGELGNFSAGTAAEADTILPRLAAQHFNTVLQSGPDEFYIVGCGLNVIFLRDPDADGRVAGIAGIAELTWKSGGWAVAGQMNGDQTDQGRQLLMDPHAIRLYRVRLYDYPAH